MEIKIYAQTGCKQCQIAKMRTEMKGLDFEYINDDVEALKRISEEQGYNTLPFVFVDGKFYKFHEYITFLNKL